jgi:hypothetical protein
MVRQAKSGTASLVVAGVLGRAARKVEDKAVSLLDSETLLWALALVIGLPADLFDPVDRSASDKKANKTKQKEQAALVTPPELLSQPLKRYTENPPPPDEKPSVAKPRHDFFPSGCRRKEGRRKNNRKDHRLTH